MKKTPILWVLLLALFAGVFPALGYVVDLPANQPAWRGQTGSTLQQWAFTTSSGGEFSYSDSNVTASPFTNPNGTPKADVVAQSGGVGWVQGDNADYYANGVSFSASGKGWWDLGFDAGGSITLSIPSASGSASSVRCILIQITEAIESGYFEPATVFVAGGTKIGSDVSTLVETYNNPVSGQRNNYVYVRKQLWQVSGHTVSDTITITGASTGGRDSVVGGVVVDTICITNDNIYVDAAYSGPDCTFVGWPNTVAPLDKLLGLVAFPSLQTGVDRAPTNGTVNVASGTYGALNVVKPLTVNLGQATAQATVSGLSLVASSTLAMDVNGTTPGTQYDQWVVNGPVNLGGATLNLAVTGSYPQDSSFVIVNNDGTDPVLNTFSGLPEGAVIDFGVKHFKISYQGGSGNDVTLTAIYYPPVAALMTVHRPGNLSLKIPLSDVATNWSDGDGYAVNLISMASQSTNGGSLVALNWTTNPDGSIQTASDAYIGYINPNMINDQIQYTIRNSQGQTSVGYINIVIQDSVTGTSSIASVVSGNPATLTARGVLGYSYITERSTDLVSWVPISTNTVPLTGIITVTDNFGDLGGIPPSSAYYRMKWKP